LKEISWQGPIQIRVVEQLLRNFGSWVPRKELIDFAFADDPDGGPLDANNFMAVTVNRIRRRLRLFGFELDGKAWYGSRLRWAVSNET
jgi:DNA-binding response OmpR family regulator